MNDLLRMRESRIKKALRTQHRYGRIYDSDEYFMLEMLDLGLIGMDGFKFCEVIDAQRNRALMLEEIERKRRER